MQLVRWFARSSFSISRRYSSRRGVSVWMTMPSRGRVLQAGSMRSLPSASTMQRRQEPMSLTSFK